MNGKYKQKTLSYVQQIEGEPSEIFPLLCPERETEWLDGWEYEMVYSKSGLAEENAVFKTSGDGEHDIYWMVSRYEPSSRIIEFVRFNVPERIVKIAIKVQERQGGSTPVEISYTYMALSEEQNEYIINTLPSEFEQSMIWWEKSMNHSLKTGEMLTH